MKRAASIEALLKQSGAAVSGLKRTYEASLHDKEIRDDVKVNIKNIFENLRSCLDYLARDIFETCCASSGMPDRLYFPIRPSLPEFNQAISSDYPGLPKTNEDVYDILEAMQPYHDPWLGQFNKLNNENKHQDLVEQTRMESRHVTVSRGGGSVSYGPGVTFGGGVSVMGVPIDPRTQLPVPSNQVTTGIVIWVNFCFRENGLSVLPFIEESLEKVEHVFRDLQEHI